MENMGSVRLEAIEIQECMKMSINEDIRRRCMGLCLQNAGGISFFGIMKYSALTFVN
jgi:hypothetical protein